MFFFYLIQTLLNSTSRCFVNSIKWLDLVQSAGCTICIYMIWTKLLLQNNIFNHGHVCLYVPAGGTRFISISSQTPLLSRSCPLSSIPGWFLLSGWTSTMQMSWRWGTQTFLHSLTQSLPQTLCGDQPPTILHCVVSVWSVMDSQQTLLWDLRADEAGTHQDTAIRPAEGHRSGYRHHLCHWHCWTLGRLP